MHEQRLTQRLLKYWNRMRREEIIPPIQRLNPAAVEDLWPHCLLVGIVARKKTVIFTCDFMGEAIAALADRDMIGIPIDNYSKQFPGSVVHKRLLEVYGESRPMEDAGYFVSQKNALIKYRACFLPFGKPSEKVAHRVTHIVVGLSYRIFS